jgi:hypothetical protein
MLWLVQLIGVPLPCGFDFLEDINPKLRDGYSPVMNLSVVRDVLNI